MAEDYLTDDEQLENVKRIVAENWVWVVGGVVLGAALVFGYRHYDASRNNRALRAAGQFDAMTAALDVNDAATARQVADGIIKDYPTTPYADQAQLALARLTVDQGQPANAVGPLTQVMTSSKDTELRHIARLRLARVLIDQGKPDDALSTLAADTPGAFAARFHEVRGDALRAKNDPKGALTEYKAALEGQGSLPGDSRGVDAALLQLKMADLGDSSAAPAVASAAGSPAAGAPAAGTPAAGAPAAGTPAASSTKVKP